VFFTKRVTASHGYAGFQRVKKNMSTFRNQQAMIAEQEANLPGIQLVLRQARFSVFFIE
jgi:hypothetical protein